jgi:hypothetical protein
VVDAPGVLLLAAFMNVFVTAVDLGLLKSKPGERVGGAVANRLGAVDVDDEVRVEAVVDKLEARSAVVEEIAVVAAVVVTIDGVDFAAPK